MCHCCMGGQLFLVFCDATKILSSQFSLIRRVWRQLLLATHDNDASILIQSSGHPKKLPVRLSAEEAAKAPLRPLHGSGDSAAVSANVTNSPVLLRFTKFD